MNSSYGPIAASAVVVFLALLIGSKPDTEETVKAEISAAEPVTSTAQQPVTDDAEQPTAEQAPADATEGVL
ncbi:MAG: hypothetical protein V2I82_00010, partial [Halieaceae bacterium]|nr:hypothetical protein [Halieaceae bacterium]